MSYLNLSKVLLNHIASLDLEVSKDLVEKPYEYELCKTPMDSVVQYMVKVNNILKVLKENNKLPKELEPFRNELALAFDAGTMALEKNGIKTKIPLIDQYGSTEKLLFHAPSISSPNSQVEIIKETKNEKDPLRRQAKEGIQTLCGCNLIVNNASYEEHLHTRLHKIIGVIKIKWPRLPGDDITCKGCRKPTKYYRLQTHYDDCKLLRKYLKDTYGFECNRMAHVDEM